MCLEKILGIKGAADGEKIFRAARFPPPAQRRQNGKLGSRSVTDEPSFRGISDSFRSGPRLFRDSARFASLERVLRFEITYDCSFPLLQVSV